MASRRLLPTIAAAALHALALGAVPAPAVADAVPAREVVRGDTITTNGTYERSADILVRDSESLDDTDLRKAKKLRMAGRLYGHAGLREKARITMIHAGIAAYRSGESALAAHIFLDAAESSLDRGVPHAAESAADRAGWVLRNGDLSADERASVLRRVRYLDGEDIDWSGTWGELAAEAEESPDGGGR